MFAPENLETSINAPQSNSKKSRKCVSKENIFRTMYTTPSAEPPPLPYLPILCTDICQYGCSCRPMTHAYGLRYQLRAEKHGCVGILFVGECVCVCVLFAIVSMCSCVLFVFCFVGSCVLFVFAACRLMQSSSRQRCRRCFWDFSSCAGSPLPVPPRLLLCARVSSAAAALPPSLASAPLPSAAAAAAICPRCLLVPAICASSLAPGSPLPPPPRFLLLRRMLTHFKAVTVKLRPVLFSTLYSL